MVEKEHPAAKHWAVLIGVNFYPTVKGEAITREKCLDGAVPDVLAMKEYLENAPYPVNVVALTATSPNNPTLTEPMEDPECWPAEENVTQSLKRVKNQAKEGDRIYIHFSGHGMKVPVKEFTKPSPKGPPKTNLALILYGKGPSYRSYLRGHKLRDCLTEMLDKGLFVTMILDCCFSGSVERNNQAIGTSVRSLEYDVAVDGACPLEPWGSLFDLGHVSRQSELQKDYSLNSEGYTVFAACGLDEKAFELQSNTGERHGGLTQFFLWALVDLQRRNVQITQESLYHHICARFKAAWGAQTPRLYGKRGLSFFGELQDYSVSPLIPVFWREVKAGDAMKRLYIRAGHAHGVSNGDVFDAYPFGTESGDYIRLRVSVVHSLHSEMVGFESATTVSDIKDGWNAKLVRSEADHKIAIRITEDVYSYAKSAFESDILQFVQLHIGNKDQEACQFNVELNDSRQYCIYDGSMELLLYFKPLSIDVANADVHLLYILQRLASYKYLESLGIERTARPLSQTTKKTATSSSNLCTLDAFTDKSEANRNGPKGPFHVNHEDSWSLKVENRSKETVYLALFSFTSSWKIEDLTVPVGNNSFEDIPPSENGSQGPIRLKMKVPTGDKSCKDVIKVFLTNRPTFFPALRLDRDLMDHPRTRTAKDTVNSGVGGIPAFLSALNGMYRDANGTDHTAIEHEAWSTENFIIVTSLAN